MALAPLLSGLDWQNVARGRVQLSMNEGDSA